MAGRRIAGVWAAAGAVVAAAGLVIFLTSTERPAGAQPPAPSSIVRVIGVGGVLTADGTVWSYFPDRGRWKTIDESFHDQGKETHILPLPVPPSAIKEMVTFGFLLTGSGDCWLYNMDKDRWEKLPAPGAPR